jgi:hypothetical protein
MPLGSGYSVEAQITGADLIGGLQIEVVPAEQLNPTLPVVPRSIVPTLPVHPRNPVIARDANTPHFSIYVRTLIGKTITLRASNLHTVHEIKSRIQNIEGIPPDQQRLVVDGRQLEDDRVIADYGVTSSSVIHLVLRLRGGGPVQPEMGIAAGGLIKQTIVNDNNNPTIWDTGNGTIFNVQILNSAAFEAITGKAPPKTPVTARTYAAHGYPYYDIYDEKPSGIKGDFSGVQSVAEKDLQGVPALEKAKAVAEVIEDTNNPLVLLDQAGGYTGFRPVKVMEEELIKEFGKL